MSGTKHTGAVSFQVEIDAETEQAAETTMADWVFVIKAATNKYKNLKVVHASGFILTSAIQQAIAEQVSAAVAVVADPEKPN